MPGVLEAFRARTGHQSSGSGILSSLTGGGGILSTAIGPLQSRLASIQAAGSPQAKVQALVGTLGARMKTLSAGGGILSKFQGAGGGGGGGGGGTSADSAFQQQAGVQRVYGNPTPPAGVQFR